MFSYSLGVWGTSEKVYENLPFLTSSRIAQRTGCRKQTAAVTGSDPHSKSLPCSCVAMLRPWAGATSGSSWASLSAQPSRATSVLVPPHNLEARGLPFYSLLSYGCRPWHGQAARWAGQEVAGCDQPDNRAEVSKVGQCSKEGPRLELGGPLYPSPTTTLCGFSASLGLLLCRKLPRGLFQGLDESAFEAPSTALHRWDTRWLLPRHERVPLGPPSPGCTWPSQELGI